MLGLGFGEESFEFSNDCVEPLSTISCCGAGAVLYLHTVFGLLGFSCDFEDAIATTRGGFEHMVLDLVLACTFDCTVEHVDALGHGAHSLDCGIGGFIYDGQELDERVGCGLNNSGHDGNPLVVSDKRQKARSARGVGMV